MINSSTAGSGVFSKQKIDIELHNVIRRFITAMIMLDLLPDGGDGSTGVGPGGDPQIRLHNQFTKEELSLQITNLS